MKIQRKKIKARFQSVYCSMRDMHASTLERQNCCYHLDCILDNYLKQQHIPYHICPVSVICADRWCPYEIENLFKNLSSLKSH